MYPRTDPATRRPERLPRGAFLMGPGSMTDNTTATTAALGALQDPLDALGVHWRMYAPADLELGFGKARVLLGDCVERMRELPDGSADVVLVDPPYSSGATREAGKTGYSKTMTRSTDGDRARWFGSDSLSTDGFAFLLRACALEWFRILKPGGHALIFIDWRMLPAAMAAVESADLRKSGVLIWNKTYFGMGKYYRNQYECIMHFTKGVGCDPQRRDIGNVLSHKPLRTRNGAIHPTEKPVPLLRDLLSVVCPPGGLVVDCFAGSGSTGEAVLRSVPGARVVLIERDQQYHVKASLRLAGVMRDLYGDRRTQEVDGPANDDGGPGADGPGAGAVGVADDLDEVA